MEAVQKHGHDDALVQDEFANIYEVLNNINTENISNLNTFAIGLLEAPTAPTHKHSEHTELAFLGDISSSPFQNLDVIITSSPTITQIELQQKYDVLIAATTGGLRPITTLVGSVIFISSGTGALQLNIITAQNVGNNARLFDLHTPWLIAPDATSKISILAPTKEDHAQYVSKSQITEVVVSNLNCEGQLNANMGFSLPGGPDIPYTGGCLRLNATTGKLEYSTDAVTWIEVTGGGTGPVGRFGTKLAGEWFNVQDVGGWASFLFVEPLADSTANGWHYQRGSSTNNLKNWRFNGAAASDMLADNTYWIKETKIGAVAPFSLKVEIFSDSAKTTLIATGTTGATPVAEDLALVNSASQTVCTVEVGSATLTVVNSILYKGGINVAVTVYGQENAAIPAVTLSQTRHFSFHRNWQFNYSLKAEFPLLGLGAGKIQFGNAIIQSVWASPLDKFYGTLVAQNSGGSGFSFPLAVLEA